MSALLLFGEWLLGVAVMAASGDLAPPARLAVAEHEVRIGSPIVGTDALRWDPEGTNRLVAAGKSLYYEDRVQTGPAGRAVIAFTNGVNARLGNNTMAILKPPADARARGVLNVLMGRVRVFDRRESGEMELLSPACNAIFRGTEIVATVEPDGTSRFLVVDGFLIVSNALGVASFRPGEAALATLGQEPRPALVEERQFAQWSLYHPAVLMLEDLDLGQTASDALALVLNAYRTGDLGAALDAWPLDRENAGEAERILKAGLWLSAGRPEAAREFASVGSTAPASLRALRVLLMAGSNGKEEDLPAPDTASLGLALSYYHQSRGDLDQALHGARTALAHRRNGFTLSRTAELEFSFGRANLARALLDEALTLTPRLASAHALAGFVSLARNHHEAAMQAFDRALELDPGLGDAWLGRGLAQIHAGSREAGRADIFMAVTVDPGRWVYRSYLAKADGHLADRERDPIRAARLRELAARELALAKTQDPFDPTPWLYSALEQDRAGRTAEAIADLQESIARNGSRAVYRSRLLLDEDAAVRSANLASLYGRADMRDLSLREAAKAVAVHYTDPSAHLHLAASFDALRDPTRFTLRHEAEWFNEHLLGTLLAPVGVGSLSHHLSPNEYSRLFQANELRFDSNTEYFSRGEWRQNASQSGNWDRIGYALDLDSLFRRGENGAQDLQRIEWYSRAKFGVTPADTLLVMAKFMDYETGDFFVRFDPAQRSRTYKLTERQDPLLLAGWRHEWSPEQNTLLLLGHLEDRQQATVSAGEASLLIADPGRLPPNPPVRSAFGDLAYQNDFEAISMEVQHLAQWGRHFDVVGLRFQDGGFRAASQVTNRFFPGIFGNSFASELDEDFNRFSAYAYHSWRPAERLVLSGGFSYDSIEAPANYRRPPVTSGQHDSSGVSPKAAIVWTPTTDITVRGAWMRSLGGVTLDESVRLEPSSLAGFAQSFRSLVNESLIGSVEQPRYDTAGVAMDLKLGHKTWLGLTGLRTTTEIERTTGILDYDASRPPGQRTRVQGTDEQVDYAEHQLGAVLNHGFAPEWFGELSYRFIRSELEDRFPWLGRAGEPSPATQEEADLHEIKGSLLYRRAQGFFARVEVGGYFQEGRRASQGIFAPAIGHRDGTVQGNVFLGWEWPRRRAEFAVGLLNVTDDDYRFSALTPLTELPRDRTLFLRLRLNF